MTLWKAASRAYRSTKDSIGLRAILLVLLSLALRPTAGAGQQAAFSEGNSTLTTAQVVARMVEMNLRRAQALHSYSGSRTYKVEYRGLLGTTSAEMAVDVTYRAPGTKEFTIRSSNGSTLIIEKVLKKLLQAEAEAASAEGQRRTALNNENYEFTMVGSEGTGPRLKYVLTVEPRTKSKFLYRGRIWVDAADFAVVRLEAEPAKNPSFWTKSSQIEQSYQKLSDFWLPERNHSISSIRIGGRAELTIEYQSFQITASEPVRHEPMQELARSAHKTLSQAAKEQ